MLSVAVKAETGFASLMLIFLVLPLWLCINRVHSFMMFKILKSETNLVPKCPSSDSSQLSIDPLLCMAVLGVNES